MDIREAVAGDAQRILEMVHQSAVAQGYPGKVVMTAEELLKDGFGPTPRFWALLADVDDRPAGMALFFETYSTWVSRLGLYLEDLYVRPEFRRQGVARALMLHLAEVARSRGYGRFQWFVLKENRAAIRFYESMGAQIENDWCVMSLREKEL